ncbi:hypothetical protein NKDENANG_04071 [Candidatus Entotheonellaceae bacterium PAL068K]
MRSVRVLLTGIVYALWLAGCGADGEPPVAVDDAVTTAANTAVLIDVTANDTDPDSLIDLNSVDIVAGPSHGATVVTGVVVYTPAPGFVGTDSFRYTVDDEQENTSNIATVTVTVTAVADFVGFVKVVLSVGNNAEPV